MRVLIACEFSGIVRDAFLAKGHDAWSCDLLDSERPGQHNTGDVRDVLGDGWDLMIAHPPCTYLANSGVRWLDGGRNGERMAHMVMACEFFNELLGEIVTSAASQIPCIAVENPIQHKYARERIRKPDQIVQPWMFGCGETKATCLWLKNLTPLAATNVVAGREGRIHKMPPGVDRGKNRSRTYEGIAAAMAEQWGSCWAK